MASWNPTTFKDLPPEEKKKKTTICGVICCVLILAIIGGAVGGIYAKKESLANAICQHVETASTAQAAVAIPAAATTVDLSLTGNLKVSVGTGADSITVTDYAKKGTAPTANNVVDATAGKVTSKNTRAAADLFTCKRSDAEIKLAGGQIASADVTVAVTGGYEIDVTADVTVKSLAITTNGQVTLDDKNTITTTKDLTITSNKAVNADIDINGGLKVGGVATISTPEPAYIAISLNGPVAATELKVTGLRIDVHNNSTLSDVSAVPKASFTVSKGGSLHLSTVGFVSKGSTNTVTLGATAALNLDLGSCAAQSNKYTITLNYISQTCAPVKNDAKPPVDVQAAVTIPIWMKCPYFDMMTKALVGAKAFDKFGPYKAFKADFDTAIAVNGGTDIATKFDITACATNADSVAIVINEDTSVAAKLSTTWNQITVTVKA